MRECDRAGKRLFVVLVDDTMHPIATVDRGQMMQDSKYPQGCNEDRVRRVMEHYEQQSEEEAVVEDEAAFEDEGLATVEIPKELVPAVRTMIADYERKRKVS